MKFNDCKVCDELSSRVDGAPMLNGFIKSETSLTKPELLFNPNQGGHFRVWVGGGQELVSPPFLRCLKLVRIMLETSNLTCKYTQICDFRRYTS